MPLPMRFGETRVVSGRKKKGAKTPGEITSEYQRRQHSHERWTAAMRAQRAKEAARRKGEAGERRMRYGLAGQAITAAGAAGREPRMKAVKDIIRGGEPTTARPLPSEAVRRGARTPAEESYMKTRGVRVGTPEEAEDLRRMQDEARLRRERSALKKPAVPTGPVEYTSPEGISYRGPGPGFPQTPEQAEQYGRVMTAGQRRMAEGRRKVRVPPKGAARAPGRRGMRPTLSEQLGAPTAGQAAGTAYTPGRGVSPMAPPLGGPQEQRLFREGEGIAARSGVLPAAQQAQAELNAMYGLGGVPAGAVPPPIPRAPANIPLERMQYMQGAFGLDTAGTPEDRARIMGQLEGTMEYPFARSLVQQGGVAPTPAMAPPAAPMAAAVPPGIPGAAVPGIIGALTPGLPAEFLSRYGTASPGRFPAQETPFVAPTAPPPVLPQADVGMPGVGQAAGYTQTPLAPPTLGPGIQPPPQPAIPTGPVPPAGVAPTLTVPPPGPAVGAARPLTQEDVDRQAVASRLREIGVMAGPETPGMAPSAYREPIPIDIAGQTVGIPGAMAPMAPGQADARERWQQQMLAGQQPMTPQDAARLELEGRARALGTPAVAPTGPMPPVTDEMLRAAPLGDLGTAQLAGMTAPQVTDRMRQIDAQLAAGRPPVTPPAEVAAPGGLFAPEPEHVREARARQAEAQRLEIEEARQRLGKAAPAAGTPAFDAAKASAAGRYADIGKVRDYMNTGPMSILTEDDIRQAGEELADLKSRLAADENPEAARQALRESEWHSDALSSLRQAQRILYTARTLGLPGAATERANRYMSALNEMLRMVATGPTPAVPQQPQA